jgi:hypothetical protein
MTMALSIPTDDEEDPALAPNKYDDRTNACVKMTLIMDSARKAGMKDNIIAASFLTAGL